jgi:hypothetical protein
MNVNRILTAFSVLLPVVFAISMIAFIFSFAACVKDTNVTDTVTDVKNNNGYVPNVFAADEIVDVEAQYDNAELIVFNSKGDVVYNKIIPGIKSAL